MPLFEYVCESCGRRTEVLQRISDPPLASCPECGGPVRKLLSAPAFQFKGSGWYVTDYAKKGAKEPSSAKSESGSGEASPASSSARDSTSGTESAAKESPAKATEKPSSGSAGSD